jgi:hypothetical protein
MAQAAAAACRARNPARATRNQELNFDLKKDIDYYKQAIEKLDGDPYDGTNLPVFLKKFNAKALQFNWNRFLTFVVDPGPPRVKKSLVTHYGEISREVVRRQALTYIGMDNHRDQDSDMMFNCLRKSITDAVFAKVTTEPERYTFTIDDEEDEPEETIDGPCFLKAIIDQTYTSTRANSAVARENLTNLAEYTESLPDSNILEFNAYVKKQVEVLASGGKTTTDLVTHLFKGYSKAKDKVFREWIRIKKLEYFDQTFNINPNCLDFMELTENHYKDALIAKEWLQPDEDQQTIIALQTKIEEVQAQASRSFKK